MPARKKRGRKRQPSINTNKALVENTIKLQSSLADTLIVMNRLLKQQSEMIEIFREASKHINDLEVKDETLKPLVHRLDELLKQNMTIAKGLVLLEQYVKERQPSMAQTRQF